LKIAADLRRGLPESSSSTDRRGRADEPEANWGSPRRRARGRRAARRRGGSSRAAAFRRTSQDVVGDPHEDGHDDNGRHVAHFAPVRQPSGRWPLASDPRLATLTSSPGILTSAASCRSAHGITSAATRRGCARSPPSQDVRRSAGGGLPARRGRRRARGRTVGLRVEIPGHGNPSCRSRGELRAPLGLTPVPGDRASPRSSRA
jgi:hypothetical protein